MRRDRPLVCLVTDRRRLVGDGESFATLVRAITRQVGEAAGAGVDLIQVRERGLETAQWVDLVGAIVEIVRGSTTAVVVNDRLDVALGCGADGVHLRGDSVPPPAVRAAVHSIAPHGFLVGRSVHGVDDACDVAPWVEYLIAGSVFPTVSKPGGEQWLGTRGLSAIVQAVDVPVLAIGGISLEAVAHAAAAGAAGIAAIGLFLPGAVPMAQLVHDVRAKFDTVAAAS